MGDVKEAFSMMDQMQSAGVQPNIVAYTLLIDVCAKANQMERAESILRLMESAGVQPNFKTFSSLIGGYANQGDFGKAWKLVEQMKESGFSPDYILYMSLITACANTHRMNDVPGVLATMEAEKIATTPLVWNTIAKGYALVGDTGKCLEVFERMQKLRNSVALGTLNALMKAFVRQDRLAEAKKLLSQMKTKHNQVPDTVSYNAMMLAYARVGQLENMMDLLDTMVDRSVKPSPLTFYYLLHTAAESSQQAETIACNIEALLDFAADARVYVNRATLDFLIQRLARSNGVDEEGIRLCIRMVRQMEDQLTPPRTETFAALLPVVQSLGEPEQVQVIQSLMKGTSLPERLASVEADGEEQNEQTLEMTLHTSLQEGRFDMAEHTLNLLRRSGLSIRPDLLERFIRATLTRSTVEEAQFEFTFLREEGHKPSADLFGMLAKARGKGREQK